MGSKTGEDQHINIDNPNEQPDPLDLPKQETTNQDEEHHIKIEDSANDIKSTHRSFSKSSSPFISEKQRFYGRAITMGCAVAMMLLAQFSVPDNEVKCVVDNVFRLLEPLTRFFNEDKSHEMLRNGLQILCSLLMDITFLVTFGYWMFKGRSSRLVMSAALFYIVRALIQKMFWMPFPDLWWWMDPGFPSLVVPYGRGSDFFFSGHAGFLVVCANEWNTLGNKRLRNFVLCVLAYTVFILLTYRVHYSIDIFGGIFFADYCYEKVTKNKELIDESWTKGYILVRNLTKRRKDHSEGVELV